MIETRINPETGNTEAVKPQTITTSMILDDLDSGVGRDGIKEKYNLEGWEVTQMFKHPALKGKKVKKIKKLSFEFIDDTATDTNQTSIPVEIFKPELQNADSKYPDDSRDINEFEYYTFPQYLKW